MTDKNKSVIERDIIVRNIETKDIDEVLELALNVFGPDIAFKRKHIENQLKLFPEGQICIEYQGTIIGSSSSLIVNIEDYNTHHSFDEIADKGYIRNHQPNGKNLYGIEVVVHPEYRHMKIGKRLYEARRKLCEKLNLKSIVIGGRIPNYHKYANKMSAAEYTRRVLDQDIYDPVLSFQHKNGFILKGVMPNYLPEDKASMAYATLMEWQNPHFHQEEAANTTSTTFKQ